MKTHLIAVIALTSIAANMLKADEVSNILNSIKISPSIQADSEEKEKSDLENSKSQASAMENAENEWREKLTEQYQDNKIDKEMRAILSEWLNGKPATRMILPNDEGVIVDYNSVSREFTAKMKRFNDEGQLVTSYNNVLAGDLSIDLKEWNGSIHIDLEYIPAASRFIDPQSIQDIFWWAPKFKEWAIKLLSIPEDERPKQEPIKPTVFVEPPLPPEPVVPLWKSKNFYFLLGFGVLVLLFLLLK
jgi:uncharacterized protein YecA (UPF0149 family)